MNSRLKAILSLYPCGEQGVGWSGCGIVDLEQWYFQSRISGATEAVRDIPENY